MSGPDTHGGMWITESTSDTIPSLERERSERHRVSVFPFTMMELTKERCAYLEYLSATDWDQEQLHDDGPINLKGVVLPYL